MNVVKRLPNNAAGNWKLTRIGLLRWPRTTRLTDTTSLETSWCVKWHQVQNSTRLSSGDDNSHSFWRCYILTIFLRIYPPTPLLLYKTLFKMSFTAWLVSVPSESLVVTFKESAVSRHTTVVTRGVVTRCQTCVLFTCVDVAVLDVCAILGRGRCTQVRLTLFGRYDYLLGDKSTTDNAY